MDEESFYEFWGTYSVFDQMRDYPFVSDVVLFDKLVIPVPPKKPTQEDASRWKNWDPDRLEKIRGVLGKDIIKEVSWGQVQHDHWNQTFEKQRSSVTGYARKELAGEITASLLLEEVPKHAKGIIAVSPYTSLDELEKELDIEELDQRTELSGQVVTAVVGHEFLVPDIKGRDELDVLKDVAEMVTKHSGFREKRRLFHSSLQRFIRSGKTDVESVRKAVEVFKRELDQLHELASRETNWRNCHRAFFFFNVALGALSAFVPLLGLGTAVPSIGQFTASQKLSAITADKPGEAALLLEARRGLDLGKLKPAAH